LKKPNSGTRDELLTLLRKHIDECVSAQDEMARTIAVLREAERNLLQGDDSFASAREAVSSPAEEEILPEDETEEVFHLSGDEPAMAPVEIPHPLEASDREPGPPRRFEKPIINPEEPLQEDQICLLETEETLPAGEIAPPESRRRKNAEKPPLPFGQPFDPAEDMELPNYTPH
jgi:hypothetical protein